MLDLSSLLFLSPEAKLILPARAKMMPLFSMAEPMSATLLAIMVPLFRISA